jgi:hypothetical protein
MTSLRGFVPARAEWPLVLRTVFLLSARQIAEKKGMPMAASPPAVSQSCKKLQLIVRLISISVVSYQLSENGK